MPVVGARLGDDTDHAAGGEAKPRVEVVANNAEFLGRVRIRKWRRRQDIVIHVIGAIQHVIGTALPPTIGGSCTVRWESGESLRASARNVKYVNRARGQQHQRSRIPPV